MNPLRVVSADDIVGEETRVFLVDKVATEVRGKEPKLYEAKQSVVEDKDEDWCASFLVAFSKF